MTHVFSSIYTYVSFKCIDYHIYFTFIIHTHRDLSLSKTFQIFNRFNEGYLIQSDCNFCLINTHLNIDTCMYRYMKQYMFAILFPLRIKLQGHEMSRNKTRYFPYKNWSPKETNKSLSTATHTNGRIWYVPKLI